MTKTAIAQRLHHTAYVTKDQEATRAFYEDVLGFPLLATWSEADELFGALRVYCHTFFGLADGSAAIVCVRQGGVRLLAAGQGTPARVLDTRFLGDVALVELAVQGLDAPILARVRESDVPVQGTEIGVGIDTGAVLIFEADNGERPAVAHA